MKMINRKRAALLCSLLAFTLLSGCNSSEDLPPPPPPVAEPPPPPPPTYSAEVTWTEFGIPHVNANDWLGLGYGTGYAFATENFCALMSEYVVANGETARYFGASGSLQIDFVWKLLNNDERIARMLGEVSPKVSDLIDGYAAGFNRYISDTGVESLPAACRGAEWVRDITSEDVMRNVHKLSLLSSGEPLAPFIASAVPPSSAVGMSITDEAKSAALARLDALDAEQVIADVGLPRGEEVGSNAYAVGGESSQTGAGVLLSNPHFPWDGSLRLFMIHQTMGDELDVMGEALFGVPIVGLGFNKDVAWGHTVSTSTRFSLYELTLNAGNPLQYIYDGEIRDMEAVTVSAEQLAEDGSVTTVDRTFYLSHFGPILDLSLASPDLGGWPTAFGTVLTYRDANLDNSRIIDTWLAMGAASSTESLKDATRMLGVPLVNTLATDRSGDAFFGNVSVSANITNAQLGSCIRGPFQNVLTSIGFLTLDGSDSACEWGVDADAPADGLFGWDNLPKLDSRDYVANANDSHWIVNPRNYLEGFSQSLGGERIPLNLRPRQALDQAERRLTGEDGLGEPGFNIDNIRTLMYQATNYTADLTTTSIVDVCSSEDDWASYSESPTRVAFACELLAEWDRTHTIDSTGGHIFWELWQRLAVTPGLWTVPFDVADPLNTPRQIDVGAGAVSEAIKVSLSAAVKALTDANVPLDAPLGTVQFEERNGVRYPIHGGDVSMMFSAIISPLVPDEGYSAISSGNSYIQAVTWDGSDCPDAYGVLTYSQSTNPESPHFADSTEAYSESQWIDMPYCQADIEANELRRTLISE